MIFSLCVALSLGVPFFGVVKAQGGDVQAGAELHKQECQRCHGPEGKGDGPAGKLLKATPADWTDPERMGPVTDDTLFKAIKEGGKAVELSGQMPEFGSKLSDDEIHNLIAFVRSLSK
jgi:cytochrome c oxidase cbb3-type subunit 3